jgi:RNA polymerase sigma factor (sigma-70 family)
MKAIKLPLCTAAFLIDQAAISSPQGELLSGTCTGQLPSVAVLYKAYAPALMGLILRIVKHDELAQDVLQETFVKIWKSRGKYHEAKGRPYTWMARMATNTAIDHLRFKGEIRSAQNKDITSVFEETEASLMYHFNPDTIGLRELTECLNESQKLLLDMVYFKGYTHVEAAEELGMSLGTVKTKVRLGLLKLRKMFTTGIMDRREIEAIRFVNFSPPFL